MRKLAERGDMLRSVCGQAKVIAVALEVLHILKLCTSHLRSASIAPVSLQGFVDCSGANSANGILLATSQSIVTPSPPWTEGPNPTLHIIRLIVVSSWWKIALRLDTQLTAGIQYDLWTVETIQSEFVERYLTKPTFCAIESRAERIGKCVCTK